MFSLCFVGKYGIWQKICQEKRECHLMTVGVGVLGTFSEREKVGNCGIGVCKWPINSTIGLCWATTSRGRSSVKAAGDKYGKMEEPMPSIVSVQFLLSFPVLFPFTPYFPQFC